jgi:lipoate-protein ligase A
MSALVASSIYHVPTWTDQLAQAGMAEGDAAKIGSWMDDVLGTEFTKPAQ